MDRSQVLGQGRPQDESNGPFKAARTIGCIYLSVSIPLRITFLPDFQIGANPYSILDLLSTILFITDAVRGYRRRRTLWFGTTKVSPIQAMNAIYSSVRAGSIFRDAVPTPARLHRPIAWFIPSLAACFPLEYITLMNPDDRGGLSNYLMLNRILIIICLPRYIEDLADFLEVHGLKNIGVQRAWKLFFAMAIAGHWCCCGFFLIAKIEAAKGGDLTWIESLDLIQIIVEEAGSAYGAEGSTTILIEDPVNAYIQSLYWAYITMITTGFGDITPLAVPETVWCILTMILGVIITTCAIANLQLLVTNADAAYAEHQHKTEAIAKYMKYRRLPNDLQNRIMEFYRYQWDLLKGADEVKYLEELPSSIQQQVANFMCRDLIASLPLLRKANLSLLNALADCVEINIYSPNDEILKTGEIMRGAILVSRGEVEVLSGMRVIRKMRRLDYFAAESLFIKDKSTKTIRGRTFCEIFLLPTAEFQQIIRSQCDQAVIKKMKETASLGAKSAAKVNKLFGSADDLLSSHGFRLMFLPNSKFRYTWDLVALVGYTYYYFSIPLMVMRSLDGHRFSDHIVSFSFAFLWDFYFAMDLYLNFSRFMYFEEGIIVFDHERIRHRFLHEQNYRCETIATLPIDLLGCISSRWCFMLRLSKLFRLPSALTRMKKLERAMADLKLDKGMIWLKMLKLNLALVITCHWIGCLWHSCANLSSSVGYENNWIDQDEAATSLSIDHSALNGNGAYFRSLYFAIVSSTTVGYGDIIPRNIIETTFATIVILFGGLILPAIVGGLAAYLGNIDLPHRKFRNKIFRIKQYMRQRSMDKELVEKVVNYYHYLWSRQGDMDKEENCLEELPLTLRREVSFHVHREHINAVPFLSNLEEPVKDLLGLSLKSRIFMPTDDITCRGEIGSSMFFLEKGEVEVSGKDGLVYHKLQRGQYFGESALIPAHDLSTATAVTFCDVFELSREDFQDICVRAIPQLLEQSLTASIQSSLCQTMVIHNNISQNLKERPKCSAFLHGNIIIPSQQNLKEGVPTKSEYSRPAYMYGPDSGFRAFWDVVLVFVITFNLWKIPFSIAFPEYHLSSAFNYFPDVILFLDMYLNYQSFAFYDESELTFDRLKVKSHYMSSRFKFDTLATLPYEWLCTLMLQSSEHASITTLLRVPRMLWVIRLPKALNTIFCYLEDKDVNISSLKLIEFLSGVMMIAHFAAVGFIVTATMHSNTKFKCETTGVESVGCKWKGTWIERQISDNKLPADGGNSLQQYLRAFNWSLPTLVVVVIGDVVPVNLFETTYAIVVMLLGVSLNGAIIGQLSSFSSSDEDSLCFAKKADDLKKFMKGRHVSPQLLQRIEIFMTEVWHHNADVNADSFLPELPQSLQIEMTTQTKYRHIKSCPFFDFCSVEIVKALSLRLTLSLFSSNDNIVSWGDSGQEMFFLERGTVEIMSADDKTIFATLSVEDSSAKSSARTSVFFGETSLFFKTRRTGTVRCATFCEVYRLKKDCLSRVLGLRLGEQDFDLSQMLKLFTSIAKSNDRRNRAVSANLGACRTSGSKLSKLIDPDSSITYSKKVPLIFKPASSFRVCWDLACVAFVLYFAFEIPLRTVFFPDGEIQDLEAWVVVDFLIESFFILDLYFRHVCFPTTIQNPSSEMEKDSFSKKKIYIQNGGLLIDGIMSFPISVIAFCNSPGHLKYLRIVHMIRIGKIPSYLQQIKGYLNLANIRISAATRLLTQVFGYYFLVIHWYGCVWFAIHRYLEPTLQYTWATTDCPSGGNQLGACLSHWLENLGKHDICTGTIRHCYTRSVYFVLTTMSTVGYGDISPVTELETIFQNVVVLTAAYYFASIINAFGEFFSQNDESGSSAFMLKIQRLREYMAYRKLPDLLRDEILFYHKSRWETSHVLEERKVKSMLSQPLAMEVSFEMLSSVISKFPILRECSTNLLKRISHELLLQMSPRGIYIYHAGDIGFDLYFLNSGLVRIELPKDISILDEEAKRSMKKTQDKMSSIGAIYRPGNHFGESCLESISGVRQESAVAITVVELYLLRKESLDDIFSYTPPQEKEDLKRKLLTRNGNVWHSFEESEPESLHIIPHNKSPSLSRSERFTRSPTSFLSWTRPQRFTLSHQSPSNSISSLHPPRRKRRLRSFSAEASTQMLNTSIRSVITSSICDSLPILDEDTSDKKDATLNALNAARQMYDRAIGIDLEIPDDSCGSESTCSSSSHMSAG